MKKPLKNLLGQSLELKKKKFKSNEITTTFFEEEVAKKLFNALDTESKGYIYRKDLLNTLNKIGISKKDPRLHFIIEKLSKFTDIEKIHLAQFIIIIKSNLSFIENALTGNLVIPDFEIFCDEIKEIYSFILPNEKGKVANYIPQLSRIDPNQFGVSICTIDGQMFSLGDVHTYFCVQSTCKPINYCIIQDEHGEKKVHKYIGKEPSGHSFNMIALNPQNLPHNPLNNAGAIMACALLKPHYDNADRFDYVIQIWKSLNGGIVNPRFNNAVYLSEKNTSDRNFALAHFMKEKKAFPPHVKLLEVLDFYFQCCSIEMTAQSMAVVAATLANGGICPLTEKIIFYPNTVKNCLSMMSSCGMYDFSGEFAFSVGLPAKSGVSGAIIIVVPNVMGFCVWSPRIDLLGNSVRGLAFCNELVKRFNFHIYDSLIRTSDKKDPRQKNMKQSFRM